MGIRSSAGLLLAATAATAFATSLFASAAVAAGNGLPRTYDAQRIDSPQPENGGLFSLSLNVAGDLNGDGSQDLISPQVANFNTAGRVYVFSGATGALIDTITAPDPGGTGGNAQFGLLGTAKVGVNRSSGQFSDLGSCPGGSSGVTCPANPIRPPDGVPDLLIGATGVDVGGVTDVGRVYVIDGATRAVLKRIDMPAADRALTTGPAGFGREVLAPEGQPPCEGNAGIGACNSLPFAVSIGDLDDSGRADVVVGARRVDETPATAQPGSHCAAAAPAATCRGAGRVYVYRGEDIAGTNPAVILDGSGPGQTVRTIRNPDAQADNPLSAINIDGEGFGNDLMPIGDVGRCNAALTPGARCPRASSTTTPDGLPEFLIMAPGEDYPLANPDPAFSETGAAYLVDGATATILHVYLHPEPQRAAAFSGTFEHSLAAGDMGDTLLPDVSLGAPGQNGAFTASGRAYVMSGNFKSSAALTNIGRLDDPTPDVTEENFGGSSAGVGDLVPGAASPRNELLVGASGPRVSPLDVAAEHPLDVVFFNPGTERALQIVRDPDAQTASAFGDSIEPLGDVNRDGFLDFAVAAFRYNGPDNLNAGRFYIFRSDNSPAPDVAPPPAAAPPAPPAAPAVLAGRTLGLTAGARSVRSNSTVRLSGKLAAAADPGACLGNQEVELQRRVAGDTAFTTFARVRTAADGAFAGSDRPRRATRYRALAAATAQCLGASSPEVAVAVVPVVRVVTARASLSGSRVLRITLACPASTPPRAAAAACRGSVRLRTRQTFRRAGAGRGRLTLATASYKLDAGSRRTLRLRVSRANLRSLRASRRVVVDVRITNRDDASNTLSSRARVTLRVR